MTGLPATRVGARGAAVLVGAVSALVLLAAPADAHADLVRSTPTNGATLARAPAVAQLWFSEEISPEFSSAQLVDGLGHPVAGSHLVSATGDPRRLELALPDLATGTYGVVWRVLAEDDGHTTGGIVAFGVGGASARTFAGAAEGSASGTSATTSGVLLRWLSLCLLAGVIGGLAVVGPVLGRAGSSASAQLEARILMARHQILGIAAVCAVLSGAIGIANLADAAQRVTAGTSRAPLDALANLLSATRWGHLWLVGEAAMIALIPLILSARRRLGLPGNRAGVVCSVVLLALVLTIVWVEALGSHAVAVQSSRTAAVLAYAVHVLTALLWMGALPALMLVFWPRTQGVGRVELMRACRGPFTTLAVTSVTLLVVTGLYGAGRQVPELGQLLSTGYGRTLLVKTALLLVVGGLGLVNSGLLDGRLPERLNRLRAPPAAGGLISRRLIVAEATVGAVLLAAAGFLADTAPPRPAPLVSAAPAGATSSATRADLIVTVEATPNQPGMNGFTVLAASSRRPPPAAIDAVTLELAGGDGAGDSLRLGQVEPGRYFGTTELDRAGPLRVIVVVQRDGKRLTVPVPWQVDAESVPAPPPQPVYRLAPYLNGLALCLLALALAGVWWRIRTRRRQRVDVAPPEPAEKILEDVR